jgi:hypothetical protein
VFSPTPTQEFKRFRIKRYSLPLSYLQGNQKTPEQTTIGKRLYFCSRKFVGQLQGVTRASVVQRRTDDSSAAVRHLQHASRRHGRLARQTH